MCTAVTCPSCGKVGWRGCGAHVEQVLRGVPEDQRCKCHDKPAGTAEQTQKSILDWLRGR